MIGCFWTKQVDIISALINITNDINTRDIREKTALLISTSRNKYDAIKLLLRSGADFHITNLNDERYDVGNVLVKRIIDKFRRLSV